MISAGLTFVDTNYFLRFLLKDVTKQHLKARRLFENGALGKIKLVTSLIVFFETYWVLSSFYEKKKLQVATVLTNILQMDFVKIENRELLQTALEIFTQSSLDLEDAYNLAYARKIKVKEFKTFDQRLTKKI